MLLILRLMIFLKSVYNNDNNNNNDIWVSFILRAILHGLKTLLHYWRILRRTDRRSAITRRSVIFGTRVGWGTWRLAKHARTFILGQARPVYVAVASTTKSTPTNELHGKLQTSLRSGRVPSNEQRSRTKRIFKRRDRDA